MLAKDSSSWMNEVQNFRAIENIRRIDGSFEACKWAHKLALAELIFNGEQLLVYLRRMKNVPLIGFKVADVEATVALLSETQWLEYGPKMHPERLTELQQAIGISEAA